MAGPEEAAASESAGGRRQGGGRRGRRGWGRRGARPLSESLSESISRKIRVVVRVVFRVVIRVNSPDGRARRGRRLAISLRTIRSPSKPRSFIDCCRNSALSLVIQLPRLGVRMRAQASPERRGRGQGRHSDSEDKTRVSCPTPARRHPSLARPSLDGLLALKSGFGPHDRGGPKMRWPLSGGPKMRG